MQPAHLPRYQQQLQTAVAAWTDLSPAESTHFLALFDLRQVPAGEHILLPGDRTHELIFVCAGLLRFFYLSEDGVENNKAFVAEDTFAGPLAASVLDLPVIYGIETLEPTVFWAAPYAAITQLYAAAQPYERFGRRLAEFLLVRKELRTRGMLQQGARERYTAFLAQEPLLAERVPQYHIASYLGITEVSLSRIRRELRDARQHT